MGTNARIGLELADGNIASVHLNYDGYLDHAGKMLLEHYQTPEIVQKLIELGDISCLYQNLGPGPDNNTNTIAYARDRNEDYSAPDIAETNKNTWTNTTDMYICIPKVFGWWLSNPNFVQ